MPIATEKESWLRWGWRHSKNVTNVFGVPRDKKGEVKASYAAQFTNWLLLSVNCVASYIWYLAAAGKVNNDEHYGIGGELSELIGDGLKEAEAKAHLAEGFMVGFSQSTGQFPGNYSAALTPIESLTVSRSFFSFSHFRFYWRLYAWFVSPSLLLADILRGMHIRHVRAKEYMQKRYIEIHGPNSDDVTIEYGRDFLTESAAANDLLLRVGSSAAGVDPEEVEVAADAETDRLLHVVRDTNVYAEQQLAVVTRNLEFAAKKYANSYSGKAWYDYFRGFFTHNNGRVNLPNISHVTIPCIANYILFTLEHLCDQYVSSISVNYNQLIAEPEHAADNPALLWVTAHISDVLSWGNLETNVLALVTVLAAVYGADAAAIAATWMARKLYHLVGDRVRGHFAADVPVSTDSELHQLPEVPGFPI